MFISHALDLSLGEGLWLYNIMDSQSYIKGVLYTVQAYIAYWNLMYFIFPNNNIVPLLYMIHTQFSDLKAFLMFITGCRVAVGKIAVWFVSSSGYEAIAVNTCGSRR